MDILDAYYVTQGFKATEGQPWQIQKATAMKTVYENKPIFIQDNELLVGGVAFKPRAGILNPDSACSVIEKQSAHVNMTHSIYPMKIRNFSWKKLLLTGEENVFLTAGMQ